MREKQARMLLALRDASQSWYISSVAKAAGTTYVNACNFLSNCERLGLVSSEKHGKIKNVRLTERGQQVAEHVSGIYASTNPEAEERGAATREAPAAAKQKSEEKDKR